MRSAARVQEEQEGPVHQRPRQQEGQPRQLRVRLTADNQQQQRLLISRFCNGRLYTVLILYIQISFY